MLLNAFLTGRWARRAGKAPARNGALVAVVFGLISSLAVLSLHVTPAQIRSRAAISPSLVSQEVAIVNSPLLHIGVLVVSAFGYGLLGLLMGWMGGASTRAAGGKDAAV